MGFPVSFDHRESQQYIVQLKHPFANRLLEPEIRAVADVALASGTAVLEKMGDFEVLSDDPLCRIAFFRAAHAGFIRGQTAIIDRILSPDHEIQLGWQDELTLRKIIDALLGRSSTDSYTSRDGCAETVDRSLCASDPICSP